MASLHRHGSAPAAGRATGRYATAVVRIARPPRAANDNRAMAGRRLHRLMPLAASAAVLAAALWTVLS